jgi:hypothetical protein
MAGGLGKVNGTTCESLVGRRGRPVEVVVKAVAVGVSKEMKANTLAIKQKLRPRF